MTVLFFSRLFYPHIGGVEKHVLEISNRLLKRGHKIIVVAEKHANNLKEYENINGIKVYRIPIASQNWLKKFSIWLWLWKHRAIIEKANIAHCHDVAFWFFPFKLMYPRKPLYTTFHGYESFPVSGKAIFIRKLSEMISNGTICVGYFMKKWYGIVPDIIMYGAVQTVSVRENTGKRNSALFFGRLDFQTGIATYIDAYKKIRKTIPNFSLIVHGEGPLKEAIVADVAVKKFNRNIRKEISKHQYIFVSRYLSILEAMAAKRLVIAVYDNPLKKDYLTMSPFAQYITIAGSGNEVYKKIMYFNKHKNEERILIEKAYAWVKTQNWNEVIKDYLVLWKKTT